MLAGEHPRGAGRESETGDAARRGRGPGSDTWRLASPPLPEGAAVVSLRLSATADRISANALPLNLKPYTIPNTASVNPTLLT